MLGTILPLSVVSVLLAANDEDSQRKTAACKGGGYEVTAVVPQGATVQAGHKGLLYRRATRGYCTGGPQGATVQGATVQAGHKGLLYRRATRGYCTGGPQGATVQAGHKGLLYRRARLLHMSTHAHTTTVRYNRPVER